ncbi:MAG: hypothetical protein ACP5RM_03295, partial [Candidatus Micrarchaeia archaeon]
MSGASKYYLAVFLMLLVGSASAATINLNSCNSIVSISNASYIISNSSCKEINLLFPNSTSNANVSCQNIGFGRNSSVIFEGFNHKDFLFNCSFYGAKILVGNNSNPSLISPGQKNFSVLYANNSSISIGYFLNVSVFEPFGSNSVESFGNRVAAFAYILPLLNNTVHINNTQLQMDPWFDSNMIRIFEHVNETVPFGAYWINQTQIFENITRESYGNIFGHKVFIVPSYTMTKNAIIDYNPYAIEYSFLGYDQLVMYFLNITNNTNLIPVYIQPIYPKFNYYYLPDNGNRSITIKWLVAVPPPDYNWNFSAYIYRYSTMLGFIMNPLNNSVPRGTVIQKMVVYPSDHYDKDENGTYLYYLNYTAPIGIGLNSSIVLLPGTIPGEGKFIQDSTTPSFSYGLGFCSTQYNSTSVFSSINESGTYDMVNQLFPLLQTAPVLIDAPCYIGGYVSGSNITINCNKGIINDTHWGFVVNNAKNVTFTNCSIYGNGFMLANSTGISIANSSIFPTPLANSYGISIYNSSAIELENVKIGSGFSNPYSEKDSSGVKSINSSPSFPASISISGKEVLYGAAAFLLLAYIFLFFKLQ